MVRRRSSILLLMVPLTGGCSDLQIDQRDELGMESEGRYELVMMEDGELESSVAEADAGVDSADTSKPVYFDPKGGFTVQIGFYADASTAAEKVKTLTANGYPAYSIPSKDRSAYRVRIGYFESRADADRFGRIFVEDRGGEFWVDLRANEGG